MLRRKADDRETRPQSADAFRVLVKEWLDKCKAEGRAEKTLERNEWLLGTFRWPNMRSMRLRFLCGAYVTRLSYRVSA